MNRTPADETAPRGAGAARGQQQGQQQGPPAPGRSGNARELIKEERDGWRAFKKQKNIYIHVFQ